MQPLDWNAFETIGQHPELQPLLNFQCLTALKAFFALLTGDDLNAVDELSLTLVHSAAFQMAAQEMQSVPAVAALIQERYLPPAHDLDRLLQCPPESLGFQYAASLQQKGLERIDPDLPVCSDTAYIEYRWQQTHDIWHILTGFSTSSIDEIGLQAFYLAQFRLPLASLLIANALIASTLLSPEDLPSLLKSIEQGWQMGSHAKPLFAQKWEEEWEKPVSQWQAELQIQPILST
jgi:ubiquinone biosynthesis protein COQ4